MRNTLTHAEKVIWHWYKAIRGPAGFSFSFYFYLPRTFITWSNQAQVFKAHKLWHFLKVFLVKYWCAFVERPLQGTSSLASQLTIVSLDNDVQTGYTVCFLGCATFPQPRIGSYICAHILSLPQDDILMPKGGGSISG